MKRITAIIRREKLHAVKHAMRELGPGMTVTDVKGQGRQKGIAEVYRGSEYCLDLLPKTQIDMVARQKTRSVLSARSWKLRKQAT